MCSSDLFNSVLVTGIKESKSSSWIVGWEFGWFRTGPGIVAVTLTRGWSFIQTHFVPFYTLMNGEIQYGQVRRDPSDEARFAVATVYKTPVIAFTAALIASKTSPITSIGPK